MRWEKVAGTHNSREEFHLFKSGKKVLTLTFNSISGYARIECYNEKRVFHISKEGSRHPKTVLLNEYGVKIGELGGVNKQNRVEINDEQFFYSIHKDPLTEFILYKESKIMPLVTCGIKTVGQDIAVDVMKDNDPPSLPHDILLLALSWYMFYPVAKENMATYAL
jgi:hypothetical protein